MSHLLRVRSLRHTKSEETIKALGYDVRDYFLANPASIERGSRAVMAYCTAVKGDGIYGNWQQFHIKARACRLYAFQFVEMNTAYRRR